MLSTDDGGEALACEAVLVALRRGRFYSSTGPRLAARLRRRSWGMPYGRVEIVDALGRRAWTNPLRLGEE